MQVTAKDPMPELMTDEEKCELALAEFHRRPATEKEHAVFDFVYGLTTKPTRELIEMIATLSSAIHRDGPQVEVPVEAIAKVRR